MCMVAAAIMAPTKSPFISPREMGVDTEHSQEPIAGRVASLTIGLITACILSNLITQRYIAAKERQKMSWIMWLVFLIYTSSIIFISGSIILQFGIGTESSKAACNASNLLCIGAYLASKFIYLFLVDRGHIIRGTTKSRLKSKLYLWNSFGMLSIYAVIGIFDFIYRIAKLEDGKCTIGLEWISAVPLIAFDTVANIYLTLLFLGPLMGTYSVRWQFWKPESKQWREMDSIAPPPNTKLRNLARRTLIGCIGTLVISLTNISVLMALDGEVSWLCLLCCSSDILFSALIINWVTSTDPSTPTRTQRTTSAVSQNTLEKPFDWRQTSSSTQTAPKPEFVTGNI